MKVYYYGTKNENMIAMWYDVDDYSTLIWTINLDTGFQTEQVARRRAGKCPDNLPYRELLWSYV